MEWTSVMGRRESSLLEVKFVSEKLLGLGLVSCVLMRVGLLRLMEVTRQMYLGEKNIEVLQEKSRFF